MGRERRAVALTADGRVLVAGGPNYSAALREGTTRSVHMGAELPIANPSTFLGLVEGLCRLYRSACGGLAGGLDSSNE